MTKTKCPYCGILYRLEVHPRERRHDQYNPWIGCPNPPSHVNPDERGLYTCYTCNVTEGTGGSGKKFKSRFSDEERARGVEARCKTCVTNNQKIRYAPFAGRPLNDLLGDELRANLHNPEKIHALLQAGADPNHKYQMRVHSWLSHGDYVYGWDDNGTPMLQNTPGSSPLSSIVREMDISSYYIPYKERLQRARTTRLLLNAGADFSEAVPKNFNPREAWNRTLPEKNILKIFEKSSFYFYEQFHNHTSIEGDGAMSIYKFLDAYVNRDVRVAPPNHLPFLADSAVGVLPELRPYYEPYRLQRAWRRFLSHRAGYFSRDRKIDHSDDGLVLPALPTEIETHILILALFQHRPILDAGIIPPPIAPLADEQTSNLSS